MPRLLTLPLNLPESLCTLAASIHRLRALAALSTLGLALSMAPATAQADTLHFNCRGWMPIYLGSWVPINPDPSDFDMLSVEVNEQTRMTSFVLTMIGRASFATKVTESHVKGAIPYKQLMVDDFVEYIDFMLNRGTGEVVITALEKSRRAHLLYKGRCQLVKPPF